jgi:GNAT superfamily N-acetyltransferase
VHPGGSDVRLRDAEPGDAPRIAGLHAESWRRHYRGAFPDSYLDGEIREERLAVWTERLTLPAAGRSTTVAELDGELVGFVHTVFDEDASWGALLDNLHVVHGLKRSGVGSRLMSASARAVLARSGPTGLHLWVLEQNTPARAFYAARGGSEVEWVPDDPVPGGGAVPAFRVAWPDPSVLLVD